jgi:hypothetical protein
MAADVDLFPRLVWLAAFGPGLLGALQQEKAALLDLIRGIESAEKVTT